MQWWNSNLYLTNNSYNCQSKFNMKTIMTVCMYAIGSRYHLKRWWTLVVWWKRRIREGNHFTFSSDERANTYVRGKGNVSVAEVEFSQKQENVLLSTQGTNYNNHIDMHKIFSLYTILFTTNIYVHILFPYHLLFIIKSISVSRHKIKYTCFYIYYLRCFWPWW